VGSEDGFCEGKHMAGKLKPLDVERETRPGKYSDGDGLYLVVASATSKNWNYRYWKDGKQRWLGLTASRESLVEALEILTRQPADDGSDRVRWYTLQRATPLFAPEQKDEWSIPGELSPEAALAYFTKHEGFDEGLEIADDDGPLTEFVLEKREVLRRHVGASQRLSAGRLIDTYSVRRRSK
jgi:hypothetical protein